MSIATFNKSVQRAKLVVESARKVINEDAAVVNQLTTAVKNSPTIFVISSEGVNVNQLRQKVRAFASTSSTVTEQGDKYVVSSNNPSAVTRILKMLRISATVQGDILNNPMTDNPTPA